LKNFFENHRGSGKFISHRVAARFFYKPSRRGSFFFLTSRRGSGSWSAAMDISGEGEGEENDRWAQGIVRVKAN
jgi:hypothetical protein